MNATCHARILVLEDERLMAMLLEHGLTERGHDCVVEPTLNRALARLETDEFDAVVSDLYLPDTSTGILDGLNDGHLPPVIVITGSPSMESATYAINSGAYAYRSKPLDMADFLSLVEAAASVGRMQNRMRTRRDRLGSLLTDIDSLRQLRPISPDALDQTLVDYIGLLLGNNIESLAEATELLGLIDRETAHRPVRRLSRHPETEMFRTAIAHTVDILERTKHAFKSRELADLRRQLEGILTLTDEQERPLGHDGAARGKASAPTSRPHRSRGKLQRMTNKDEQSPARQ